MFRTLLVRVPSNVKNDTLYHNGIYVSTVIYSSLCFLNEIGLDFDIIGHNKHL